MRWRGAFALDGLGGLDVGFDGRSHLEFAPGAGLDIRIGDQAGFSRTSIQAPTYSDLGQGLERLTSRGDLVKRKTVVVRKGKRYVARAKGR